jgi:GTPase
LSLPKHRLPVIGSYGTDQYDEYQIVFSDTPGMLKPKYELHKNMMSFVNISLEDADVIVFVTDLYENPTKKSKI